MYKLILLYIVYSKSLTGSEELNHCRFYVMSKNLTSCAELDSSLKIFEGEDF